MTREELKKKYEKLVSVRLSDPTSIICLVEKPGNEKLVFHSLEDYVNGIFSKIKWSNHVYMKMGRRLVNEGTMGVSMALDHDVKLTEDSLESRVKFLEILLSSKGYYDLCIRSEIGVQSNLGRSKFETIFCGEVADSVLQDEEISQIMARDESKREEKLLSEKQVARFSRESADAIESFQFFSLDPEKEKPLES